MRERFVFGRGAVLLLAVLVVGWVGGGIWQWVQAAQTGYGDIFPPQMLLGVLLCAGAGALLRGIDPGGSIRGGAVAGIVMVVSLIVAYLLLMAAALGTERIFGGEDGETWMSFLLELPFWLGIPALGAAGAGALGWLGADVAAGGSRSAAPHG